jgi:DNA-directed RNA polymerase specialized sigma24 family protein
MLYFGSQQGVDQGGTSKAVPMALSPRPPIVYWNRELDTSGRPIDHAIRSAADTIWGAAVDIADAALGDPSITPEVMDVAVERAAIYVTERGIADQEWIGRILLQFYRREVRRLRSRQNKMRYVGRLEDLAAYRVLSIDPAEALHHQIDAATLLEKADPKVRGAMVLHYAHSNTWDEVARQMGTNRESLKKSCQRELAKVRRWLRTAKR